MSLFQNEVPLLRGKPNLKLRGFLFVYWWVLVVKVVCFRFFRLLLNMKDLSELHFRVKQTVTESSGFDVAHL